MPSPRKRVNTLARDAAEQFDSTLLSNRVSEQVSGDHETHSDLVSLVELAEECYTFSEPRDHRERVAMAAFEAAEALNDVVDDVVEEEVATACQVIIDEAPEWTNAWDAEEIDAAIEEARGWLAEHEAAADRAGVAEEGQR
ncbi:hypothetical protein VB779_08745 [Haloarculaceae archaeon H-GB11]|nr:hypothetical protein [Haloarculaceae archaeon H-GB11]